MESTLVAGKDANVAAAACMRLCGIVPIIRIPTKTKVPLWPCLVERDEDSLIYIIRFCSTGSALIADITPGGEVAAANATRALASCAMGRTRLIRALCTLTTSSQMVSTYPMPTVTNWT